MASKKIVIVSEKSQKEYTAEEIQTFACSAKTRRNLAILLGVHYNTITNTEKDNPEFCEAMNAGFADSVKPVIEALYKKAQEGEIGHIKYVLNNVASDEWSEKSKVENTIKGITHESILQEIENAKSDTKPTE